MRRLLIKRNSTAGERRFAEILKRNHIPFLHRTLVEGHEIDFIIEKYAIEIDGHPQSAARNALIVRNGYIPLHYTNSVMRRDPRGVEESLLNKLTKHDLLLKNPKDSR